MNEELETKRLCTPMRRFLLTAHDKFMMVVETVMSPFVKVMEECNGTASWKSVEKRLNENK